MNSTILSVIGVVILLFLYFHYNRKDPAEKLKVELFENRKERYMETQNGLVGNGSFQYQEDVKQLFEKKGENEIVKMVNPGESSHVLKQEGPDTRYVLKLNIEPGKQYMISYWVGKTSNCNNKDKNFNILIGKRVLSGDGVVIASKNIGSVTWKKVQYSFNVAKNDPKVMKLFIGYKGCATGGERYVTDIEMHPVIKDSGNFPPELSTGLELYVNANAPNSYSGNGRTMKDIGGDGHDMIWKNNPTLVKGGILTKGNSLKGKINSGRVETMTVSVCFTPNNFNQSVQKKMPVLFNLPGGVPIMAMVSNDMKEVGIRVGNVDLRYHGNLMNEKMLLSVVLANGVVTLYRDGTQLTNKGGCKPLYLDGDIIVNGDRDLDIKLQSVLVFNRAMDRLDLGKLAHSQINYVDKDRGDKSYHYHMNNDAPGLVGPRDTDKLTSTDSLLGSEKNSFVEDHDTTAQRGIKDSWHERVGDKNVMSKCVKEFEDELKRHGEAANPRTLKSCKKACSVKANEKESLCQMVSGMNSKKECKDKECPQVYLAGDEYMVYIIPGSKYAKKTGRSGNFSYGTNRKRAREIFMHNFKGCRVPEILTPHGYSPDMRGCPFLIDEMNPCKQESCKNANWSETNPYKESLTKGCRRAISNYCDRFKYKDDACICWRPQYKNLRRCRDLRDYVDNMKDNCRVDVFKIEDHPDIKDYIRKDKIPCWNCKI